MVVFHTGIYVTNWEPAIIKSQKPSRRPRDFFDVYHVAKQWNIDFSEEEPRQTLSLVFGAKRVPLELLKKVALEETYEYHEEAFMELEAVVDRSHRLESFRFYFNFTKELIQPIVESLSEKTASSGDQKQVL